MRYITRWGLMRNTFSENVQEHSHMVAVLAHGLALIRRDILGLPADPERCATAALFHDASEILTGDLPTPVKYYNPDIRAAYKQVERVSADKLLELLPEALRPSYAPLVLGVRPARCTTSSRRRTSSRRTSSASRSCAREIRNLPRQPSRQGRP